MGKKKKSANNNKLENVRRKKRPEQMNITIMSQDIVTPRIGRLPEGTTTTQDAELEAKLGSDLLFFLDQSFLVSNMTFYF